MMFLGASGFVFFLLLAFWIWALFDCIATDGALCRNLPKVVWLLLVIFLSSIGALAWLLLGRPQRAGWLPGSTDYASPRRPVGFEDDPRYSPIAGVSDQRSEELDRRLEEWELEQRRQASTPPKFEEPKAIEAGAIPSGSELDEREAELDRREEEIRRRELELRSRELDQRDQQLDDK